MDWGKTDQRPMSIDWEEMPDSCAAAPRWRPRELRARRESRSARYTCRNFHNCPETASVASVRIALSRT